MCNNAEVHVLLGWVLHEPKDVCRHTQRSTAVSSSVIGVHFMLHTNKEKSSATMPSNGIWARNQELKEKTPRPRECKSL